MNEIAFIEKNAATVEKDECKVDDCARLKYISRTFLKVNIGPLCDILIDNPKFAIWPGGLQGQHHDFCGGLARHTREVVDVAFNCLDTLHINGKIDKVELFLSSLFHDAGKMYDYSLNENYVDGGSEPKFVASTHKRMVHHISRGALIWSHAVSSFPDLSEKYHDNVLHAILSHHGRREWGSPVAPKTRVAWLLHLSDGISARMNDVDKIDMLYANKNI
jgi:3'-5' exoribonuclease